MTSIVTLTLNPAIDQTAAVANFKAGAVNRVSWEQADPGGKGVNVASFLSDFGVPVTVSGFLGKENAALFQIWFDRKHITNQFVAIAGRTRTNVKIIDDVQNQVTDINFPGQPPTAEDIAALDRVVDELAIDHDWFVLSGSLPAQVEPDIYAKLTQRLKAKGKTVVLDASGESLRQVLAQATQAIAGQAIAAPDLIKPNLEELQEGLGRSLTSNAEIVQAARQLIATGIGCVVVSMGAEGAIFVDPEFALWACPPPVQVISTVGAGDAMVAGFVAGKLRQLSLADCARLATAFAIGTLSQVGARLPPLDKVESLMTQVEIKSAN
jgi:1-phosphofructokinase